MKRFGGADLACLSTVIIWGCNLSIIKHALEDFSPLSFNAVRLVLASGLLLAIAPLLGQLPLLGLRARLPGLILFGILGNSVYQLLFIFSLQMTKAGNVAILMASTPVFTALISRKVGHERLSRIVWLGIGVSLGGAVLLIYESLEMGFGSSDLLGNLMILGSSICWASYTVFARQTMAELPPLGFTAITLAIGSLGFLAVSIPSLTTQSWIDVAALSYLELVVSTVFGLALAYSLWFFGVSRLGSTRTTVYSNLIPFVGVLVAWWFLGEAVTLLQLLGGGAILTGIYLTRL